MLIEKSNKPKTSHFNSQIIKLPKVQLVNDHNHNSNNKIINELYESGKIE